MVIDISNLKWDNVDYGTYLYCHILALEYGGIISMRVISGWARGKKLQEINDPDVRPTTDRVKESLFNIIQFELIGASFLDLFGGTGQIGIEALSRGASNVFIVDNKKESLRIIRKNVLNLSSSSNINIIDSDAVNFIKNTSLKFDIIFLDPPYNSGILELIFPYIDKIMNDKGIVITETNLDNALLNSNGSLKFKKSYKYGKISINLYGRF